MNSPGAFKTLVVAVFVTIFLWAPPPSSCQAVTGTLLGTVTDATGAAVGGARVMATQPSTGALHEATTNESGNYSFPDMQPGPYSVPVEAKGFKKAPQQNVALAANSATRVDL